MAHRRPVKACREARAGGRTCPHMARTAPRSAAAASVAATRRCLADPGCRGSGGGPCDQVGQCGPSTSMRVTVPSPSSSLRRRTTAGASRVSWVAQAVESVRTTSLPSAKRLGRAVCADLGADQLGPAGEDARARAARAPSRGRRPAGRPGRRAAAGRGRRGGHRRPWRRAAGCPAWPGACGPPATTSRWPGSAAGPGRGRRPCGARPRRRLVSHRGSPRPSATTYRAPAARPARPRAPPR